MSDKNNKSHAVDPKVDRLRKLLSAMDKMQSQLTAIEYKSAEPIAIVGMSCRFPGGADTPQKYWDNLLAGSDTITEIPDTRWNVDDYYDEVPGVAGKMYTRHGGFLDNVDQFDAGFFGISPREAAMMDPQQRLVLETSWEALENAAIVPGTSLSKNTGVFIGVMSHDYSQLTNNHEIIDYHTGSGNIVSVIAGRLSYLLGLSGPALTVDTACSSSLVSVHLACQSLRVNECDAAIAGGVNLILTPTGNIVECSASMLAADGRCKTFDDRADGFVRGEGCGSIVLKRLSDAIKDNDNILSVIRGSAVNHVGKSGGLTVPSGIAQNDVINRALKSSKVDLEQIDYVEAHGTGTSLGDPVEVESLAYTLARSRNKENPLLIGSVKTNIGHLEGAAGVAGLMKVVLSLQNKTIPAHLNFNKPNKNVPWDRYAVKVNVTPTAWTVKNKTRIAGVSSFGFSGTNAHIILEEAPVVETKPSKVSERNYHLLCLSAKTKPALKCLALKYQNYFNGLLDNKGLLDSEEQSDHQSAFINHAGNISYTSHIGRSHFNHRLSLVGDSISDWASQLKNYQQSVDVPTQDESQFTGFSAEVPKSTPKVGFLYTGQGSQYPDMAKDLYETEVVFRDSLQESAEILKNLLPLPLIEVLYGKHQGALDKTEYTQPALFSIEIALTALWKSWGVEPDYVLGHSLGEYVAACVSGVMTIADGLFLVAERGRLMQALPVQGGMLSVLGDESIIHEVLSQLTNSNTENNDNNKAASPISNIVDTAIIEISAYNAPNNLVLSGKKEALAQVEVLLLKAGIKTRQLEVSTGFHSTLVEPMLDDFKQAINNIQLKKPTKKLVSALTGQLISDEVTQTTYWARHIREAVNFRTGVQTLQQAGVTVMIEMGPAPVLSALARQTLDPSINTQQAQLDSPIACLLSIRKNFNNHQTLFNTLAELYTRGLPIDWPQVDKYYKRRKVNLPTYAFQRQAYWIDEHVAQTTKSPSTIQDRKVVRQGHPLLGERLNLARRKQSEFWFSQTLSPSTPAYLKDHQVLGQVIYPAAAYIEMALSAGHQLLKTEQLKIKQLRLLTALVLSEAIEVQTLFVNTALGEYEFEIYSFDEKQQPAEWVKHASGILSAQQQDATSLNLKAIQERINNPQSVAELYAQYQAIGIEYGPDFRTIIKLDGGEGESLAQLNMPGNTVASFLQPESSPSGKRQATNVKSAPLELAVLVTPSDPHAYHLHPTLLDGALQSLLGGNQLAMDSTYLPVEITEFDYFPQTSRELWCHASIQQFDKQAKLIFCDVSIMNEVGALIVNVKGLTLKKISNVNSLTQHNKSINNYFYERQWQSRELETAEANDNSNRHNTSPLGNHKSCLLVAPDHVMTHSIVKQLNSQDYLCHWLDSDAHETLLEDLTSFMESPSAELTDIIYAPTYSDVTDKLSESHNNLLPSTYLNNTHKLLTFIQRVIQSKTLVDVYLLSQQAQSVVATDQVQGLMQSTLEGMGKVIALEHPELHCKRIDIDYVAPNVLGQTLYNELSAQNSEDQIAYRAGKRYVARLAAYQHKGKTPPEGHWRLGLDERGTLENIYYQATDRQAPQSDEVEIEIKAAGMNFRDVLNALDMYPGDPGLLGGECAGVVVAVGKDVSHLSMGDRVLGIAPGSFSRYVTAPANMIAKMASNLSYEQAACLPIVYLTTHYTLNYLGKLKAGEKILIHAATGGVGQAAIQLARKAGAEIYATASPSKWGVLDDLGVTHKMNSRSLDFVQEIEKEIGECGIDLVLNSLSGETIEKTASLLKQRGRFIEIGKRDVWTAEQMNAQAPHVNYHLVDLVEVCERDPELIQTMFTELMGWFESGELAATVPTQFPMEQYDEAFRYMQQAKHTGKIVLQLPQQEEVIELKSDACYLVSGGLGGLGRLVTEWLIDQGAGHVVLLSRRPANTEAQTFIDRFTGKVSLAVADVADSTALNAVINTAQQWGQLKGIVHAAGVLQDGVIRQQSEQSYTTVLSPKVQGTWNLHQCTLESPLDFFIMFSSIASLMGSPGQSNYASANHFMDTFAAWRQAQSLPALSINWGPWDQVGMAADPTQSKADHSEPEQWASQGLYALQTEQSHRLFSRLFLAQQTPPQLAVFDIDWIKFAEQDSSHLGRNLLETLAGNSAETSRADWVSELLAKPAEAQMSALMTHLQADVAKVLNIKSVETITAEARLFDLGMDSLMAVELSNRLKRDLGTTMPSTLIFDYPTLEALADYLAREVLSLNEVEIDQQDTQQDINADDNSLQELSKDELTQMLEDELNDSL
ncbi:Polyketide synthase modules and related proteins [hydrothermal vent metagenome]|uniref:Polyketide synthase modules and related proteins n=1 Tax=hydrothermal vent metagenome TaxID=652676 RepID=A0A3B0YH28_9ZZZZ